MWLMNCDLEWEMPGVGLCINSCYCYCCCYIDWDVRRRARTKNRGDFVNFFCCWQAKGNILIFENRDTSSSTRFCQQNRQQIRPQHKTATTQNKQTPKLYQTAATTQQQLQNYHNNSKNYHHNQRNPHSNYIAIVQQRKQTSIATEVGVKTELQLKLLTTL